MSDMITAEEAGKLLDGTTPGPWELDGVRPHTAHVWPVDGSDDPITGEIDIDNAHLIAAAPDLARTVIALHAQLADAKAAQAMVVGEAAGAGQAIADAARANAMTEKPGSKARNDMMERCWGAEDAVAAIRALAPADGLAAVEALRKELADTQTQLVDWIVRADEANVTAEKAEAELAAAQQREARLLAAIEEATDPDFILGAMDNVNDMDVTLDGFAQAASRAIRAALAHNGRGE